MIELLANPFGRDALQTRRLRAHRLPRRRFKLEAELSRESDRAHQAQGILTEAVAWVADGANEPGLQISQPPEGILDLVCIRIPGHGIDRKIAPLEVGVQIVRVGDFIGVTPIAVDPVGAERGDLKDLAADGYEERPEGGTDLMDLREKGSDLLGPEICGDVPVLRSAAEDEISEATSYEVGTSPGRLDSANDFECTRGCGGAQGRGVDADVLGAAHVEPRSWDDSIPVEDTIAGPRRQPRGTCIRRLPHLGHMQRRCICAPGHRRTRFALAWSMGHDSSVHNRLLARGGRISGHRIRARCGPSQ